MKGAECMKKIFLIFCVFVLIFSCVGCAETKNNQVDEQSSIQSSVSDQIQEEESEIEEVEEQPDVTGDGYCIVVKMKNTNATVESIDDFSKYTVAYISDTDSEKYAKFYDFKEIGMYNAGNDLHSGLMGGTFELGIVNDAGYQDYIEDYDVVWDFSKDQ